MPEQWAVQRPDGTVSEPLRPGTRSTSEDVAKAWAAQYPELAVVHLEAHAQANAEAEG
jgi:hypothetical protein